MTRIAEKLNLAYHGCKESEKPELFADVEQWLQEMDDRSGARPPVTHTGRGRCIHNVPICGECQTNLVLLHVAGIEQVRNEAATPPETPVARAAAEEIWARVNAALVASTPDRVKEAFGDDTHVSLGQGAIPKIAAIIEHYFPATPSPVAETPVGGEVQDNAKQLIQDLAWFPFDILMDENAPRIAIMGSVSTLRHMQARAREIVAAPVVAAGDDEGEKRPRIICLCGSTRFIEQFAITTWELEREGYIVLGCTLLPMWYCNTPSHFGEATGTKEQCDELHKRKIDLADEVLVLNIDGYIGESTRSEIEYATRLGKPVRYIEDLQ